jgi:hypothetical protein
MPQELQDEAQPAKAQVDEGLQEGARKGDGGGTSNSTSNLPSRPAQSCTRDERPHVFLTQMCVVQDSTLEFEKRRNRPVKYDRDLVRHTLQAMKRVDEIKGAREKSFYRQRFAPSISTSIPFSFDLFFIFMI